MIAEHRGHRAPDPVAVRLDGDPPRLVVDDLPDSVPSSLDDRVLAALAAGPLTRTALRDALGVRNETLGAAFDRLVDAKRLTRTAAGLALIPVPTKGITRNGTPRATCVLEPHPACASTTGLPRGYGRERDGADAVGSGV